MLNFPGAPTDGQQFNAPNGVLYVWSATQGVWLAQGGSSSGATISPLPPANPYVGQFWFSPDQGQTFIWYDDGSSQQWVPASPALAPLASTGMVVDFAGATAPAGWYICDGSAKSRTTDALLFAVIGTTYGAGDGSTTFNVPDCRGRSTIGWDSGGLAARVTTAVSGIAGQVLGAVGGDQNLQSHTHTYNTTGGSGGAQFSFAAGSQAFTGFQTGGAGNGASQNMPPTIVMNKIIKR